MINIDAMIDDVESTLVEIMAMEITNEIDREIIQNLRARMGSVRYPFAENMPETNGIVLPPFSLGQNHSR